MSKVSSVKLNFIMNFILTVSNFLFPLISFPYASRVLGADGVGTVNFATSIISYFTMIGMLGIPTYGIRACAKVRDNKEKLAKTVQEIVVLNSFVMLLSILALVLAVASIDKLNQEKFLYLIMSSTLVFNVLGVEWLYKALERYTYISIRSIIFKVISLLLLMVLVKTSDDYVRYGGITVFAAVGSSFMNFINLRRMIPLRPFRDLDIWQHLKPTLTFFLLSVSSTIYLNVDTTLLGFIKGDRVVGYYSAATKIKAILVSVVTSLGTVLLPRLSYYHQEKRYDEFDRLVQKALQFIFIIALPLMVYFMIEAKDSILFLSGRDFLPAVLAMQLIMPAVLFIGLSNLTGIQILVPTHRERLVVYSTIIGAVVDVVINMVSIPLFGANGAAFASAFAEFVVVMVQLYYLRDMMIPLLKKLQVFKWVAAVVVAVLVTLLLRDSLNLSLFLRLVWTAILFFSSYGLVLILLKDQFMMEALTSNLKKLRKER
ncbi:oligosaccharide flippase family protein [Streptococcus saliviloxodontae]|uniref:O-antigen/teichoic acid export membrane protein n=1 Tax=Streptococcus saliviloxodontae TaxID=1349416 RepID=A0ABS2PKJ4_9STRE|nr:oligosaccharide flippase family protein [Streptococcus saliviloxodontae]MBM7635596.1 O-antigen/teichoic acid export membrane protein [Streptococcus saliviloxodontae]